VDPSRPVWTVAENLPSHFLTLGLDVSFQLHSLAALAAYNEPQICIRRETEWDLEIVWGKGEYNQLLSSKN